MEFSLEMACFRPLAAVQPEAPKASFSHDGQKISNFHLPHVAWMPQTVPFHEHAHPLHIGLLGEQAILFVTNLLTDLVSATVLRAIQERRLVSWLNLVLCFHT